MKKYLIPLIIFVLLGLLLAYGLNLDPRRIPSLRGQRRRCTNQKQIRSLAMT